ncbi:MAG: hypothetical protein PWQ35_92 [Patescibacteria group bacterium]|nr:hypothetical protein [Patescibacteria group bacterium]
MEDYSLIPPPVSPQEPDLIQFFDWTPVDV